MKVFKIQRNDGLFSCGSSHRRFSKLGKLWVSQAAISNHITMLRQFQLLHYIDNTEVIEYEIVEVKRTPICQYIQELNERRKK